MLFATYFVHDVMAPREAATTKNKSMALCELEISHQSILNIDLTDTMLNRLHRCETITTDCTQQ